MRRKLTLAWLMLVAVIGLPVAQAQTADDLTRLINRLIELDSIDLAKDVKFRAGLEPRLHSFDADESAMTVLKDPYQVMGKDKPGAVGWYRVNFVVPERIGKFAVPSDGYRLGVESNVLGSWETHTYLNSKPAGGSMVAPAAERVWLKGNVMGTANQHPTVWMSNAPILAKPGDKITVAILATADSPEGHALRHLRLRFAFSHTFGRLPLYGAVTGAGKGSGLHGARESLQTLKGEPLRALQEKLKGPLARMDLVFQAAETGNLEKLTQAMREASKGLDASMQK